LSWSSLDSSRSSRRRRGRRRLIARGVHSRRSGDGELVSGIRVDCGGGGNASGGANEMTGISLRIHINFRFTTLASVSVSIF